MELYLSAYVQEKARPAESVQGRLDYKTRVRPFLRCHPSVLVVAKCIGASTRLQKSTPSAFPYSQRFASIQHEAECKHKTATETETDTNISTANTK
jgi:hypothetical protein